jgi:aryl-alcohol dehydrogenase-like predicted oxidoreductase
MSDLISGSATAEGTARFASRHSAAAAAGHFRTFEGQLALSSIGIGTYLGKDDDATDEYYAEAIATALESGINVVDTAINYRNQKSERVIGRVLARAIGREGWLDRSEVFVATKGGFLPFDGARPTNARAYFETEYVKRGVLRWEEVISGCHAIAPRYLADQIDRSRANLGLATIDVYYLHNPEMQLDEIPRAEFLKRVRAAFEALERAAAEGKIRWYGTATWNGYREHPSDGGYLSLAQLIAIAREVAGEQHRFRVVELPFNVAMPEAYTHPTQVKGDLAASVLEAVEGQVYVMTSASIMQGKLARGLPPLLAIEGLHSDAQRALQLVRSTPGVGTALVGMKDPAHVAENAALAHVAPLPAERVREILLAEAAT